MEKTGIRLKQLLFSIALLTSLTLSMQAFAITQPASSDYRLQKVVSPSSDLKSSTQPVLAENQNTNRLTNSPQSPKQSRSNTLDTLPLSLLILSVIGLAILLFIPGKYIRKPIIVDENTADTAEPASNETENTSETFDAYMESMDAEDEIEQRLADEEELDAINTKFQGRIKARDSKYQNRVLNRRKR